MNISDVVDIYKLISVGIQDVISRRNLFVVRKNALDQLINTKLIKVAFDTRRIDQETSYNPRRGLQNYNRSEAFVSEIMSQKIKNLSKLKNTLGSIKMSYGGEPGWQDSNARILLSTIDKALRIDINDGDYSDAQPSMSNFSYIEELLHVRYRLGFDELTKIAEEDLKKVILSKDEDLIHRDLDNSFRITKQDVSSNNCDVLIEKLFGNIKASKDNPEVERTIVITIKDKIIG